MDELLEQVIGWVKGAMGLMDGLTEILGKTPAQWNASLWGTMRNVSENVVLPISYVLLGFFLLLELYNYAQTVFDKSEMVIWEPVKIFIKVAVIKTIMENAFPFLESFFELASRLISGVSGGGLGSNDTSGLDSILDSIADYGFFMKLFMALALALVALLSIVLYVAGYLVILARLIEICCYTAVAPIPMSTLANDDLGIGKNFLKSYAALALQGVLMMLIILIYNAIAGSVGSFGDNAFGLVIAPMLASGALVFCLFKCGGWAKSIMNAA